MKRTENHIRNALEYILCCMCNLKKKMFTFKTSLNTNKQKLKPQFYIKAYEFSYIEVDVDIRKK